MESFFKKRTNVPKMMDIVPPEMADQDKNLSDFQREKKVVPKVESRADQSDWFDARDKKNSTSAKESKDSLNLQKEIKSYSSLDSLLSGSRRRMKFLLPPLKLKWLMPKFLSRKIIFVVLPLIFLGIWAIFFINSAEIKITPKKEILNFDINVESHTSIFSVDYEEDKIPAELFRLEREVSQEFQSTGKAMKEIKAEGVITVYNSYSSSPQTLVKTTRFISEGGKLFRTKETVTIPGAIIEDGRIVASSFDVEVEAAEAGEDYNIGSSTFSIPGFKGTPKYTSFYGKSRESMLGGFRGEITVVSQADIDQALKTVTAEVRGGVEEELREKIPPNLKLIDEAQESKISEIKRPEAGEIKNKFQLTIKVLARALAFDENDAKTLINKKLQKEILPATKEVLPESLAVEYSLNKFPDFKNGILDMKLKVQEGVFWKIDEDMIKRELAGKGESAIKSYLNSQESIERAQVNLWPFWSKKVPDDVSKIKVKVILPEA